MARAGILYSDVARAAAKLVEDGKNPTVDSVRDALGGTGSKSTIAPLLKRWKTEHQEQVIQAEAGLPPSLLAAVKGLHQHMQAEFAQQLEEATRRHAETLQAAAEREQKLHTEHQATLGANAALAADLARAREALAQLQTSHHAQSLALATVRAENAGLQQRLADRAAEVATLDHQLTQARAQFEHYQDATAAQRTEERQGYEQRIVRLEQELAGASRHVTAQQSMLGQQEARIAHLTTDQANLQQALRTAQEALTAERSVRERLADRLEDVITTKEGLAAQLAIAQQQCTEIRMELAAKERESGMLADQARRAEERVDQLSQENHAWLQERATLADQVRHVPSPDSGAQPIPDTISSADQSG